MRVPTLFSSFTIASGWSELSTHRQILTSHENNGTVEIEHSGDSFMTRNTFRPFSPFVVPFHISPPYNACEQMTKYTFHSLGDSARAMIGITNPSMDIGDNGIKGLFYELHLRRSAFGTKYYGKDKKKYWSEGILVKNFGLEITSGDIIYMTTRSDLESDILQVYINHNNISLGLTFEVPISSMREYAPVVLLKGPGRVTVTSLRNPESLHSKEPRDFSQMSATGNYELSYLYGMYHLTAAMRNGSNISVQESRHPWPRLKLTVSSTGSRFHFMRADNSTDYPTDRICWVQEEPLTYNDTAWYVMYPDRLFEDAKMRPTYRLLDRTLVVTEGCGGPIVRATWRRKKSDPPKPYIGDPFADDDPFSQPPGHFFAGQPGGEVSSVGGSSSRHSHDHRYRIACLAAIIKELIEDSRY